MLLCRLLQVLVLLCFFSKGLWQCRGWHFMCGIWLHHSKWVWLLSPLPAKARWALIVSLTNRRRGFLNHVILTLLISLKDRCGTFFSRRVCCLRCSLQLWLIFFHVWVLLTLASRSTLEWLSYFRWRINKSERRPNLFRHSLIIAIISCFTTYNALSSSITLILVLH